MYFECNLPKEAPDYVHPAKRGDMTLMLRSVHERMEKLEEALKLSGMEEASFAATAKKLFVSFPEDFERMSPEELAEDVKKKWDGKAVEHRLDWPSAEVVVDCDFVETKEWEAIRNLGIGGSEVAAVQGVSPYETLRSVYHRKVATPLQEPMESPEAIYKRGHILEPFVINAFCDLNLVKRIPESRMFRSKKHPCVTANIDAIVSWGNGTYSVFEAKTTVAGNFEKWDGGKVPGYYIGQTRQYPAVLDDDRIISTVIGCLVTDDKIIKGEYYGSAFDVNNFFSREIKRDKESEEEQMLLEEQFFREYVLKGTEPPFSGVLRNDRYLDLNLENALQGNRIKAQDAVNEIGAYNDFWTPDGRNVLDDYFALDEQRKGLKKMLSDLEEKLAEKKTVFIRHLASYEEGTIDFNDDYYFEVTNKKRSRTVYNEEAFDALVNLLQAEDWHFSQKELAEKLLSCREKKTGEPVFSLKKKRIFSGKKKRA